MFGMGTGGTLQLLSPEILFRFSGFKAFALLPAPSKPHRIDLESVTTSFLFTLLSLSVVTMVGALIKPSTY